MRKLIISATLMTCLGAASVSQAATVLVSSFETPTLSTNYFTDYPLGTVLDGWTIVAGNADIIRNNFAPLPFPNGNQAIDLDGDQVGSISRSIATTPGQTYVMDFFLSVNNTLGTTTLGSTKVEAGTASAIFASNSASWKEYNLTFVASSNSTVLKFSSLTPLSAPFYYGPTLDMVTVSEVAPVPSSIWGGALLMTTLALAAWTKRRLAPNMR